MKSAHLNQPQLSSPYSASKRMAEQFKDKTPLLIDLDGTIITERTVKDTETNQTQEGIQDGIREMFDFMTYALLGGNPVSIVTDSHFFRAQEYYSQIKDHISDRIKDIKGDNYKYEIASDVTELKEKMQQDQDPDKHYMLFDLYARQDKCSEGEFYQKHCFPERQAKYYENSKTYLDALNRMNGLFSGDDKTENHFNHVVIVGNNPWSDIEHPKHSFENMSSIIPCFLFIKLDDVHDQEAMEQLEKESKKKFVPFKRPELKHKLYAPLSQHDIVEGMDFNAIKPLYSFALEKSEKSKLKKLENDMQAHKI